MQNAMVSTKSDDQRSPVSGIGEAEKMLEQAILRLEQQIEQVLSENEKLAQELEQARKEADHLRSLNKNVSQRLDASINQLKLVLDEEAEAAET